ncbi:MAG: PDZ domain-containing protein [Nitrospira sp.]|nr:PDZ domain-containing protein [Nitrospira sp.]
MHAAVGLAVGCALCILASGCGVGYTVLKSEAKLDRLTVPMTKPHVLKQIGYPDRILRDDGRMVIWEYSLTARRQWLYELAYCPLSVWIGGCVLYPFTNLVSDQREAPYHVVFIDNELCAWGQPSAIIQKRRACAAGWISEEGLEPVVSARGPVDAGVIGRYRTMAIMPFQDAAGVPGSGSRVAGMVTTLMLDLDLNIVERTQLDDLLREQVIQLTHGGDADALRVGQLVGADAIVVGEVQQWERQPQERTSSVSLSLRMIDVETGRLLFSGQGHLADPASDNPEHAARLIVNRILTLFGVQTGLLGSGRVGVNWRFREDEGERYYLVTELRTGLPAEKAGLKVGDRVTACNGVSLSQAKTERDAKRLCRVEAGQTLLLDVEREGRLLTVRLTAEKRPGL